jgi:DNA-nicking Smr family endonuclease
MTKHPPHNKELDENDRALWRAVTRDVKPFAGANILDETPAQPAITKPLKEPIKSGINQPSLSAKISSTPIPHKSSFQTDKRTHEKFKEGRMELDGTIDLHGLSVAEAHLAFLKFVRMHIRQQSRMLLVITGKGERGRTLGEMGAIRAALPTWINDPDIDHSILKYAPASAKHGGTGAFYILLRRTR